jgi:hypothetical protein
MSVLTLLALLAMIELMREVGLSCELDICPVDVTL